MTKKLHHEKIYRGSEAMAKIASANILICGAGAIGSNLAINLARMGFVRLTVLDKDRVEEHNIGTQAYGIDDINSKKSDSLRNLIFREVGAEIVSIPQELTEKNAQRLLSNFDLIVDAFDNSKSRKVIFDFAGKAKLPCIHAGLGGSFGHVQWTENYIVPSDALDDVCDYPLARNLILLLVAMTSEVIVRFFVKSERKNLSVTLDDLSINFDE